MTFDFEKMDAYQLSLKAIDLCMGIIAKMPRGHGGHADPLKRAATSVSFNTAEGSGAFKPLAKARLHRMPLRSVSEMCPNVQIGKHLKMVSDDDYNEAYALVTRLAQTLTKLVSTENRIADRER